MQSPHCCYRRGKVVPAVAAGDSDSSLASENRGGTSPVCCIETEGD